MKLKVTISAILRKMTGNGDDSKIESIKGVVVSDAYGNRPRNVWMLGTTGIKLQTDDGDIVSVFVHQYELSPNWALGWSVGDTLAICGKLEMQESTYVFHDAVVNVCSLEPLRTD